MNDEKPSLDQMYERISRMHINLVKRSLLELEAKRPKIYREARDGAISQYKKEDSKVLHAMHGHNSIDYLSLKYAIQHYFPNLPMFLAKPMDMIGVLKT